jgi:O-antigen/teichoic acid export membrane protein
VAKDVARTAATNVLLSGLGSLGGVLLARGLGPSLRGDLVIIVQWPAAIGLLASLGLNQAVTYRVGRRQASVGIVTRSATEAALVSGALIAVFGWWLSAAIGRSLIVEHALFTLLLMSPVYIVTGTWVSALQALDMRRYNTARSIQPIVYFAGVAALWTFHRLSIHGVVVVLIVGQLAMFLVALLMTKGVVPLFDSRSERRELRKLYSFGIRVSVGSIPRLLNLRVDQLLLSVMPMVSVAALGQYAVAASLTWLVLPIAGAFGTVAFPRVAATRDVGQRERLERLSVGGAAVSASVITLALAAVAGFVVPILFGPAFKPAVKAVWLLCPGTVCLAVNQVIGDVLRGRGRPLHAGIGEGFAVVITVAGLAATVPRYGIYGAAAVSSAAYALATVVLLTLLRRGRNSTAGTTGFPSNSSLEGLSHA